MTEERSDH